MNKSITKSLWVLWLLNMFDIFATIFAIKSGYAKEANPIMALILGKGFVYAILFKAVYMGIVCILMNILHNNGNKNISKCAKWLTYFYVALTCWHLLIFGYWKYLIYKGLLR